MNEELIIILITIEKIKFINNIKLLENIIQWYLLLLFILFIS